MSTRTHGERKPAIPVLLLLLVSDVACTIRLPALMPWHEYTVVSHPVPYITRLSGCGGELLYFGSRHTYDPADPELAEIDAVWQRFGPTLVLNEGGSFRSTGDRTRDVKGAGEAGFLRYLAGTRGVRVSTLEPAPSAEVRMLRARAFSDEKIKTFYVLRQVAEFAGASNGKPVDAYATRMLASFAGSHELRGPPATLGELETSSRTLLPALSDWRKIDTSWFDPFPEHVAGYTNEVSRELSSFRDLTMIDAIAVALHSGERVFAVVGASHVVRQDQRLREVVRRGCKP